VFRRIVIIVDGLFSKFDCRLDVIFEQACCFRFSPFFYIFSTWTARGQQPLSLVHWLSRITRA